MTEQVTVKLYDIKYEKWAQIRREVHQHDPTAITYESYDTETKEAFFTFRNSTVVPTALMGYVILGEIFSPAQISDFHR